MINSNNSNGQQAIGESNSDTLEASRDTTNNNMQSEAEEQVGSTQVLEVTSEITASLIRSAEISSSHDGESSLNYNPDRFFSNAGEIIDTSSSSCGGVAHPCTTYDDDRYLIKKSMVADEKISAAVEEDDNDYNKSCGSQSLQLSHLERDIEDDNSGKIRDASNSTRSTTRGINNQNNSSRHDNTSGSYNSSTSQLVTSQQSAKEEEIARSLQWDQGEDIIITEEEKDGNNTNDIPSNQDLEVGRRIQSNMDQIGQHETEVRRSQSSDLQPPRRRTTQDSDVSALPEATPVVQRTSLSPRPIFNAMRISSQYDAEENVQAEDDDTPFWKRKRLMMCISALFVVIVGLGAIIGVLLQNNNNNDSGGSNDDGDKDRSSTYGDGATDLSGSDSLPTTPQPSYRPSISLSPSTALPSVEPSKMPTSSPTFSPTFSPTAFLYYPDYINSLCNNDPSSRPFGNPTLFQTAEGCCNAMFYWFSPEKMNSCVRDSLGLTHAPQTASPSSISPTHFPSISPSPPPTPKVSLSPSLSPSRSPTKMPTKFPTSPPTNLPSTQLPVAAQSKAPTNPPLEPNPKLNPTKPPLEPNPTPKPTSLPTTTIILPGLSTPKPTTVTLQISTSPPTSNELMWEQLGQTIVGESIVGSQFGHSISLSNDATTLAVGIPYYSDASNTNIGQVRVYTWNQTWRLRGRRSITGELAGDELGTSVALSADGLTLAVGIPKSDVNGIDAGQVSIYRWDTTIIPAQWRRLGTSINGEAAGNNAGYSVALSSNGRICALSSPFSNTGGLQAGSVRVYSRTDTERWEKLGQSILGEMLSFSGMSISLSSDGTILAIGSRRASRVRVFKWDLSSSWIQQGADITGYQSDDYAGHDVSLSDNGNSLAIGSPRYDAQAGIGISNSGQVRIFNWTGTDWVQIGPAINGINAGQQLGFSVDMSADGNGVAIGSHWGTRNDSVGKVAVYEFDGSSWLQLGQVINGDAGDWWGYSVGLSSDGTKVAVGAPNPEASGAVQVFNT